LEGKLGAIYIGKKQVGGFTDWKVRLNITEGVEDNDRTRKLQGWRVVAWAHWITQKIEPGTEVRIKLCSNAGVGYWEGTGKLSNRLTDSLNMLVHSQMEVIGAGELEASSIEVPNEE